MTQEQELDMRNWAGGDASCECDSMVTVIYPEAAKRRWEASNSNGCVLANADNYWTKAQVEKRIQQMSGTTPEEVEQMIDEAIVDKADKADLEALSAQVASNTAAILNTYTKQETNTLLDKYLEKLRANEMFANYSKVNGTTLELNAEGII